MGQPDSHPPSCEAAARAPLVLMYHGLDPGDGRYDTLPAAEKSYVLPRALFIAHLEVAIRSGKRFVPIGSPGAAITPLGGGDVLPTFDDGFLSDYDTAFPILKEKGAAGVFFITTEWVGRPGHVTWAQLREMLDAGMAIGSHGKTHRFLSALRPDDLRRELADSKKALEDNLGREVGALSLPGGRFGRHTLAAAKACGYRAIFTSTAAPPVHARDMWIIGRIAMRPAWNPLRFEGLLKNPRRELDRLYWKTTLSNAAQALLGARAYDWLHRAWWRMKQ